MKLADGTKVKVEFDHNVFARFPCGIERRDVTFAYGEINDVREGSGTATRNPLDAPNRNIARKVALNDWLTNTLDKHERAQVWAEYWRIARPTARG